MKLHYRISFVLVGNGVKIEYSFYNTCVSLLHEETTITINIYRRTRYLLETVGAGRNVNFMRDQKLCKPHQRHAARLPLGHFRPL